MKGVNKLSLNQATMREAVQTWVDLQFTGPKAPQVTLVEQTSAGYEKEFSVTLSVEVEAEAPQS